MITALSLALLAAAPSPPPPAPPQVGRASRQAPRNLDEWRGPRRPARGVPGAAPGSSQGFTGTPTQFDETWMLLSPTGRPGVRQLRFNGTGTGWQESFLLGVPPAPLASAPLLVLWHGFGVTELDCLLRTGLMKRAMDRGWYVIAPRGAHDVNFGIAYAQQNVAYVLDWAQATLDIDPTRIYGVGFSMGGGGAMSYAARHLDPAGPLFAALVNHTGTASVAHAHANESNAIVAILEDAQMFGGPPSQAPFDYSRASVIDLDPLGTTIDPTTDLARNLAHVPVSTWSATHDPLAYLLDQSDAIFAWLLGLPANAERVEIVSNLHSWKTLNDQDVLDWLEPQTLSIPRAGTHRLLADRDGRWLHFTINQESAGAFTPFRWNFDPAQNRLVLDQTANLDRIVVDSSSLGLDPSQEVVVLIGITDGGSDEIALDDYASPPSQVLRAGVPTAAWSHDAPTQTLTLFESDGASHPQWRVVP